VCNERGFRDIGPEIQRREFIALQPPRVEAQGISAPVNARPLAKLL
jgi:hypothetical protein